MNPASLRKKPFGFDPMDIEPPPLRERDWTLEALSLDLSGACNLACRYCAEAATQPARRPAMETAVLERALERLTASSQATRAKSIRLGSGEPLLAKGLLRHLARRLAAIREAGGNTPEVFLTTNGTLLDPKTRDWLVETGWHVKISLDGPPAIQNYWRTTVKGHATYRPVAEAATDLAQRIPDRFSVTAVLCHGTDPTEVFDAIAALGVKRIELVPVASNDPLIKPDLSDLRRYIPFVGNYVDRFIATEKAEQPELVKLINMTRRVMGYDVKRVVCGAGRNFLGIGPEGDLYPCFRFIGIDEFRLGSLSGGVDKDAVHRFLSDAGRPYDARGACRECWAAPLCGGPCFAEAALFASAGDALPGIHCDYIRADASAAIRLVEVLRQRDSERLLSLLSGLIEY